MNSKSHKFRFYEYILIHYKIYWNSILLPINFSHDVNIEMYKYVDNFAIN